MDNGLLNDLFPEKAVFNKRHFEDGNRAEQRYYERLDKALDMLAQSFAMPEVSEYVTFSMRIVFRWAIFPQPLFVLAVAAEPKQEHDLTVEVGYIRALLYSTREIFNFFLNVPSLDVVEHEFDPDVYDNVRRWARETAGLGDE